MSQPSSQDSTDTQEIYSQGSFEEIWDSLGRSFSNPDKMIQGVLTDVIPFTVEYKDQLDPDNIEVSYEERSLKGSQPVSGSLSQQFSDWLKTSPTTNGITPENEKLHETLHEKLHEPAQLPPILPNTGYPGPFNFSIDFEPNTEPITKATPWVYVAEREKLFVKMQCVCPILFKIIGNPPPGSGVRGILMYKRPEHYKDIVLRCPNHKNSSKDDHPYQDHVMKCGNASTIYECCPKTGRLSLFIPLSAVDRVAGECYFKELFKFTCFNSCVGGMNRRPTCLLFSLECGEMIYGRAVMEVRICASPGRDSTEKEISNNQKNSKNADKRNEPISTTDVPTPMPLPTTNSPGSSPTYPPRASVLMSASKDPSSAPEPFQFPPVQTQLSRKRQYPVGTEGYVFKKAMKTYPGDSTEDELFTLTIRGRKRYEMLQKINEGLHLLDSIKPPEQSNRCAINGVDSNSQEYTKIQPKMQPFEIKKEKSDSSQSDVSPPSSQEIHELSQLSRSSSNASSQSSSGTTQNLPEYSALKITMKRTISLTQSSVQPS